MSTSTVMHGQQGNRSMLLFVCAATIIFITIDLINEQNIAHPWRVLLYIAFAFALSVLYAPIRSIVAPRARSRQIRRRSTSSSISSHGWAVGEFGKSRHEPAALVVDDDDDSNYSGRSDQISIHRHVVSHSPHRYTYQQQQQQQQHNRMPSMLDVRRRRLQRETTQQYRYEHRHGQQQQQQQHHHHHDQHLIYQKQHRYPDHHEHPQYLQHQHHPRYHQSQEQQWTGLQPQHYSANPVYSYDKVTVAHSGGSPDDDDETSITTTTVKEGHDLAHWIGWRDQHIDDATIAKILKLRYDGIISRLTVDMVDDLTAFDDTARLNLDGELIDVALQLMTCFRSSHFSTIPYYLSVALQEYIDLCNGMPNPFSNDGLDGAEAKIRDMTRRYLTFGGGQPRFTLFPFRVGDDDDSTSDPHNLRLLGHWILVILDHQYRIIHILDPIVGVTRYYVNKCLHMLKEWLELDSTMGDHLISKYQIRDYRNRGFQTHQSNMFDCGAFVLLYAEMLVVHGKSIEWIGQDNEKYDWQSQIDTYRRLLKSRLRLLVDRHQSVAQ